MGAWDFFDAIKKLPSDERKAELDRLTKKQLRAVGRACSISIRVTTSREAIIKQLLEYCNDPKDAFGGFGGVI